VDEQQQIDARAPWQRGERDLPRAGHDLGQDPVEGVARDARLAIEGDGAPALVDDGPERERRVADLEGAVLEGNL
jgi:hypothetical protein